jgi:gentisate 1,2-dioxygenase
VAAYQMIRPGERADSHRHTPHALRVVLDADPGVYTVVDGTRIAMAPDDVVLTPGGCWHGHANHATQNAFWIDILDVPLVHHLESMFFEQSESEVRRPELAERSPFSVGLPRDIRPDASKPAIVALGNLLPTMALDYASLATGTRTTAERMCANNLFVILSGVCRIVVDDRVVAEHCTRGDVAAIPLWRRHSIEALEEATLLRVSDRPVYENCGYFRRQTD